MNLPGFEATNDYCEFYSSDLSDVLNALDRETHLTTLKPRMLSGPLMGMYLQMVSHMMKPDRILEIGTYTGYSAICLAQGLNDGGKLVTVEIDKERAPIINKYISKAGLTDSIDLRIGDALDVIVQLEEKFDLIFLDAKKEDYKHYFDLVFRKWKKGGFMIVDNVLWSGKVMEDEKDKTTQAIVDFSEKIKKDTRVSNVMLPIRDGILLIRKDID